MLESKGEGMEVWRWLVTFTMNFSLATIISPVPKVQ